MKKMFTIITVFLSLLFTQPALAAGLTFTVSQGIAADGGGSVVVPIMVSNNPGYALVAFELSYDKAALIIKDVNAPVADMPLSSQFAMTSNPGIQWIALGTLSDWNGNGVIVNITFDVAQNAPAGDTPIRLKFLTMPDGTPVNSDGLLIEDAVTVNGGVNINAKTEQTPPPETEAAEQAPEIAQPEPITEAQPEPEPQPEPQPEPEPEPEADAPLFLPFLDDDTNTPQEIQDTPQRAGIRLIIAIPAALVSAAAVITIVVRRKRKKQ